MLRPVNDKILLRVEQPEDKVAGTNIIIPDTARKEQNLATVVAVGTGKVLANGTLVKPPVEPGAKVLFTPRSGVEITHEGEKLLVVSQDAILAEVA